MVDELTRKPPAPPPPDPTATECRRRSPRLGQQDREAALLRGTARAKLVVLNLSRDGIMGECAAPLKADELIEIVLDDRDPVQAVTRWVKGRRFGASFDIALPFEALWPAAPAPRRGFEPGRTRPDRTPVDATVVIRVDGLPMQGRIRNISARGMLIEAAIGLEPLLPVEIEVDGWPLVQAVVAWSRDGNSGLQLEKALTEEQMLSLIMPRTGSSR